MEFVVRTLNLVALSAVIAACLCTAAQVHAIENVRGKQYSLTSKHGPWMIMVTSFRNVRDEDMRKDGMSAEQAAAELVFELREKGIPAYAFAQDAKVGEIDTYNRLGRDDHRIYAAQRDMICVLAGNYKSIDDPVGQETLKQIKRFRPKFLGDAKSGAILRPDAAQKGPLSGAFMTINPLIDPKEVVQRTIDKQTKEMNDGIQYPLVKNPHKYTLRIATFGGKSATPLGNSAYRGREGIFDSSLQRSRGTNEINLNRAGHDAANLAAFLRTGKTRQTMEPRIDDGYEAYVYHDKFESIVTVGGFDSPDDPRIRVLAQFYGPRLRPDMRLVNMARRPVGARITPEEIDKLPKVMTTHSEQLYPDSATEVTPPTQVWAFDTEPKLIPVPHFK